MEVCAWSENLNLSHANDLGVLPMTKEDLLKNSDIIDQDGIIILHRHKNEEIDLSNNYKIIEERKYGISKILFFSLVN